MVIKDMKKLGYDVVPKDLTRVSEFPMPNFEEFENQTKKNTILEEQNEAEVLQVIVKHLKLVKNFISFIY